MEAAEGSTVSNSTEAGNQCGGQKAGVVSREGVYKEEGLDHHCYTKGCKPVSCGYPGFIPHPEQRVLF